MDWPWITATLDRLARLVLLPWFLACDALMVATTVLGFDNRVIGIDARVYYRGAAAWLRGENPWDQFTILGPDGSYPSHFTGPPPTVLAVAPWTALPEEAVVWIWIGLSALAAVGIVRSLRLSPTYLAFPPLVLGVLAANPGVFILWLALSSRSWVAAISPFVKIYMVVPLAGERRWTALAITAAAIFGTVVLVPDLWIDYMGQFLTIAARIQVEAMGGFSGYPVRPLLGAALIALIIIAIADFRLAGWLAVPAMWPATQFHYGILALPVITAPLALLFAVDVRGLPSVAVCLVAVAMAPRAAARVRDAWAEWPRKEQAIAAARAVGFGFGGAMAGFSLAMHAGLPLIAGVLIGAGAGELLGLVSDPAPLDRIDPDRLVVGAEAVDREVVERPAVVGPEAERPVEP